jgi:hypothetical protein
MISEGRIVVSAIMLALFAGMVGYAATFPADARFLPWVIGIPGLIFAIAQFAIELRSGKSEARDARERALELRTFGWFVAFIAGIVLFGFVVAGPVLVAAYLYFDWRERPLSVIVSALVTFAIFWGVFEWALELRLFDGFFWRWIG